MPLASDDLFRELNFSQLYHEYYKVKVESQKVRLQKEKGAFTDDQNKKFINKYIQILDRNEAQLFRRLHTLALDHIDRIGGLEEDPETMSDEQRIKVVYDYFSQGIDKDNPLRGYLSIDEHMFGKMGTTIQSFDIMENPKYRDVDHLLVMMRETFGYNKDLKSLVRAALIDKNLLMAK